MNRRITYLCILLGILYSCSNSSKTTINEVTWTGSSHSFTDTLISLDGEDTLFNFKHLFVAHSISIKENGEGLLITRQEYDEPREFYSISISDSLRQLIFDLLSDTVITNFKQPKFDPEKETRLYCGYNYLLTIKFNNNSENNFTYIPPYANIKLKYLDSIFRAILIQPTINMKTEIDTIIFDSIIFEKVKSYSPAPPVRSKVRFTPPTRKEDNADK